MNFSVRFSKITCAAVLLAVFAGCGSRASEDDAASTATDPSSSTVAETPSGTPTETPSSPATETPSSPATESPSSTVTERPGGNTLSIGETADDGQAMIVSASDVDEPTSPVASELRDPQSVDAFVADMDPRLAEQVRAAVKRVQTEQNMMGDSILYGSVVSVGCEEPVAVTLKQTPAGLETTAMVPKTDVQCLVPVTSVAIFYLTYR